MTLTSTETKWYKAHQSEIEAIINDDNAIAKYLKDWWNKSGRTAELNKYEFFRIVFYIFYKYRGINSFRTITVDDDTDGLYTVLDLAFTPDESILNERWVDGFANAFLVFDDPIECAKRIRQGVLEKLTYGIQEEVARCFEECPNSYYTF